MITATLNIILMRFFISLMMVIFFSTLLKQDEREEKVNIQDKDGKSKDKKLTNDKAYRVDFAISINRSTKNPNPINLE